MFSNFWGRPRRERGVRKEVNTGITGLWQPSAHGGVCFSILRRRLFPSQRQQKQNDITRSRTWVIADTTRRPNQWTIRSLAMNESGSSEIAKMKSRSVGFLRPARSPEFICPSLSLSIYIYIYIYRERERYRCRCRCIYIYIYIYVYYH